MRERLGERMRERLGERMRERLGEAGNFRTHNCTIGRRRQKAEQVPLTV
jgi:hypothetical protein